MQMPRTSLPFPDTRDIMLEKLETEDELDEIDCRARPANDRRPPKPRCRPTLRRLSPHWLKSNCLTPQTSPEYILMVASLQSSKQPINEVREILPERRKMPHGWPKYLRTLPKVVLRNNDQYNTEKIENHHYKEPQEQDNRALFNIQDNMQNNVQSIMQKEVEINENYKLVEEREAAV